MLCPRCGELMLRGQAIKSDEPGAIYVAPRPLITSWCAGSCSIDTPWSEISIHYPPTWCSKWWWFPIHLKKAIIFLVVFFGIDVAIALAIYLSYRLTQQ